MKKTVLALSLFFFYSEFLYGQTTLINFNNTQYSVTNILGPGFLMFPQSVIIEEQVNDYVIEVVQERINQFDNRGAIIGSTLNYKFLVSKWVNLRTSSGPRGSNGTTERVLINIGYGNQGERGTIIVREEILVGRGNLIYLRPTGIFNIPINIFISPSTNNL